MSDNGEARPTPSRPADRNGLHTFDRNRDQLLTAREVRSLHGWHDRVAEPELDENARGVEVVDADGRVQIDALLSEEFGNAGMGARVVLKIPVEPREVDRD